MSAKNCPSCGFVVCLSCEEGGPDVCPVCGYSEGDLVTLKADAATEMKLIHERFLGLQDALAPCLEFVESSADVPCNFGWRCPRCRANAIDCECR